MPDRIEETADVILGSVFDHNEGVLEVSGNERTLPVFTRTYTPNPPDATVRTANKPAANVLTPAPPAQNSFTPAAPVDSSTSVDSYSDISTWTAILGSNPSPTSGEVRVFNSNGAYNAAISNTDSNGTNQVTALQAAVGQRIRLYKDDDNFAVADLNSANPGSSSGVTLNLLNYVVTGSFSSGDAITVQTITTTTTTVRATPDSTLASGATWNWNTDATFAIGDIGYFGSVFSISETDGGGTDRTSALASALSIGQYIRIKADDDNFFEFRLTSISDAISTRLPIGIANDQTVGSLADGDDVTIEIFEPDTVVAPPDSIIGGSESVTWQYYGADSGQTFAAGHIRLSDGGVDFIISDVDSAGTNHQTELGALGASHYIRLKVDNFNYIEFHATAEINYQNNRYFVTYDNMSTVGTVNNGDSVYIAVFDPTVTAALPDSELQGGWGWNETTAGTGEIFVAQNGANTQIATTDATNTNRVTELATEIHNQDYLRIKRDDSNYVEIRVDGLFFETTHLDIVTGDRTEVGTISAGDAVIIETFDRTYTYDSGDSIIGNGALWSNATGSVDYVEADQQIFIALSDSGGTDYTDAVTAAIVEENYIRVKDDGLERYLEFRVVSAQVAGPAIVADMANITVFGGGLGTEADLTIEVYDRTTVINESFPTGGFDWQNASGDYLAGTDIFLSATDDAGLETYFAANTFDASNNYYYYDASTGAVRRITNVTTTVETTYDSVEVSDSDLSWGTFAQGSDSRPLPFGSQGSVVAAEGYDPPDSPRWRGSWNDIVLDGASDVRFGDYWFGIIFDAVILTIRDGDISTAAAIPDTTNFAPDIINSQSQLNMFQILVSHGSGSARWVGATELGTYFASNTYDANNTYYFIQSNTLRRLTSIETDTVYTFTKSDVSDADFNSLSYAGVYANDAAAGTQPDNSIYYNSTDNVFRTNDLVIPVAQPAELEGDDHNLFELEDDPVGSTPNIMLLGVITPTFTDDTLHLYPRFSVTARVALRRAAGTDGTAGTSLVRMQYRVGSSGAWTGFGDTTLNYDDYYIQDFTAVLDPTGIQLTSGTSITFRLTANNTPIRIYAQDIDFEVHYIARTARQVQQEIETDLILNDDRSVDWKSYDLSEDNTGSGVRFSTQPFGITGATHDVVSAVSANPDSADSAWYDWYMGGLQVDDLLLTYDMVLNNVEIVNLITDNPLAEKTATIAFEGRRNGDNWFPFIEVTRTFTTDVNFTIHLPSTTDQLINGDTIQYRLRIAIPNANIVHIARTNLNYSYTADYFAQVVRQILDENGVFNTLGIDPASTTETQIRQLIADWAESDNTSAIPASKLTNAPGGTVVVGNPSGAGTTDLTKLQVGNTIYSIDAASASADVLGAAWLTSAAFANGDLEATGTLAWTVASGAPSGVQDGANTTCILPATRPNRVFGWAVRLLDSSNALVDEAIVASYPGVSDVIEYGLKRDADTSVFFTMTDAGTATVVPTITVTAENSDNGLTGHYLMILPLTI